MIKKLSKPLLLILLIGLLLRLLLMPFALQADLLSMTYRAHLMSEYGLWGFQPGQPLGHYLYALNLIILKPFFGELTQFFSTGHGLSLSSTTSSVGDWLNFVAHPQVNAFIFALKIPHLLADLAIFLLLSQLFAKHPKRLLILTLWWFNPVNLYAFYIFARHDSLTLLAIFLTILALSRGKILSSLLAFLVAVQLRFQPLLYLPLLLIHLWRRFAWTQLSKAFFGSVLIILGFFLLQKNLPYNSDLYAQIRNLPETKIASSSSSFSFLELIQKPFSMATSVGGKSTLPKLIIFTSLYALLNLFYFLLGKSKNNLLQLSCALYLTLALYFLINDFSPHYYVWLSLFAVLALPLGKNFLYAYLVSILGWGLMGLLDVGNFAISQNLFLPVSSLIFNTPPLASSLPQIAWLGSAGSILFKFGLLWSCWLVFRYLLAGWQTPRHFKRLLKPGTTLFLLFSLTFAFSKPVQAVKIPVLRQENDSKILLEVGQPYSASFTSSASEFGALDLKFDTSRSQQKKQIIFRLKSSEAKEWLYENTYQVADFYNRAFYPFGFPIVSNALDQKFTYEVELINESDLPLYIYTDTFVISREGNLNELGQLIWTDLQAKWQAQQSFWIFWLSLMGINLLAITSILLWREKKS